MDEYSLFVIHLLNFCSLIFWLIVRHKETKMSIKYKVFSKMLVFDKFLLYFFKQLQRFKSNSFFCM